MTYSSKKVGLLFGTVETIVDRPVPYSTKIDQWHWSTCYLLVDLHRSTLIDSCE